MFLEKLDIETGEEIILPYLVISRFGKKAYMNVLTFEERFNSYNNEKEVQKIFQPCDIDIVDIVGIKEEHYHQGFNLLPKRFFPKIFNYFNEITNMEDILLN
ncbi:MAG: hypothetical protein AABX93_00980 [Nanoarchaeota archaeon]